MTRARKTATARKVISRLQIMVLIADFEGVNKYAFAAKRTEEGVGYYKGLGSGSEMQIYFTPHAEKRLSERSIKQAYCEYALCKGQRDNAPLTYDNQTAFKSRCHNLVVVHTCDPGRVATVLTSYWRRKKTQKTLFDDLVKSRVAKHRLPRCEAPQKKTCLDLCTSQRRAHKRNHSWEFWTDPDCLESLV